MKFPFQNRAMASPVMGSIIHSSPWPIKPWVVPSAALIWYTSLLIQIRNAAKVPSCEAYEYEELAMQLVFKV